MRVLVIVQTTWSPLPTGMSPRLVPSPEATVVVPSLHTIELV